MEKYFDVQVCSKCFKVIESSAGEFDCGCDGCLSVSYFLLRSYDFSLSIDPPPIGSIVRMSGAIILTPKHLMEILEMDNEDNRSFLYDLDYQERAMKEWGLTHEHAFIPCWLWPVTESEKCAERC